MNRNYVLSSIFVLLFSINLFAQGSTVATKLKLKEVVQLAISQSTAALRAETIRENRYWQYRTFRSNYVPQLELSGTLPDFNRSFTPVIQQDGTTEFREVNINNSNLTLGISQTIAATGGQIFINSRLDRFDNFQPKPGQKSTIYSGNPAVIGFIQPLFSFNQLKWDKRIEPLRYEESRRDFVEQKEEISRRASGLFFEVLIAQISLQIAKLNVQSNDTIYQIAQGRYQLGKIPENDLLQLELNLMNSRQQVAQANLDLETSTLSLKSYLGFKEDVTLDLLVPGVLPGFAVDEQLALKEANDNRQEAIAFQRRKLEAEREVARATGDTGFNANLFATFGLTDQANNFSGVYQNPQDQQRVRIGFSIPIIDWGRQQSRVKTADANKKLVEYTVDQDRINFEQEVFTLVKQFKMLREQIAITSQSDLISQKRYNISKNRYLIGKISITDLSLALTEKDNAKRAYIASLRNFWDAYYNLRRLTLYDFENNLRLYTSE